MGLLPFVDGEEEDEEDGDEEDDRMTPDGEINFREFHPDMAFQEALMASAQGKTCVCSSQVYIQQTYKYNYHLTTQT